MVRRRKKNRFQLQHIILCHFWMNQGFFCKQIWMNFVQKRIHKDRHLPPPKGVSMLSAERVMILQFFYIYIIIVALLDIVRRSKKCPITRMYFAVWNIFNSIGNNKISCLKCSNRNISSIVNNNMKQNSPVPGMLILVWRQQRHFFDLQKDSL